MAKVTRASEMFGGSRAPARTAARVGVGDEVVSQTPGSGGDWLSRHRRALLLVVPPIAFAGLARMAGAPTAGALVVLITAGLAALLWHRRGRPEGRSKVTIVGASRLPWRPSERAWLRQVEAETARLVLNWDAVAKAAGIDGATLREVVADPDEGYEIHISAHGKLLTDVKLPRFASAAGIPVDWSITAPDPLRPWEFVISEAVAPAADEPEVDVAEPTRPEPESRAAGRLWMLERAVAQLGPRDFSGRELARQAGLPRDWVNRHLPELAPQLGLRRVGNRWRRLAMAAGEDR